MEGDIHLRVGILGLFFCPSKQGQVFMPYAAPLLSQLLVVDSVNILKCS